jgi:hypothetical protein
MIVQMLLLIGALGAQPAVLHPQDYQDYVAHWKPASAPLCRVFTSAEQWQQTLRPAAVMDGHRPFAPPAGFWNDHAVLFVARTMYAGATENALTVRQVTRTPSALTLDYAFSPTPPASSTSALWAAAVVQKPVPPAVVFNENGRTVCTVRPNHR